MQYESDLSGDGTKPPREKRPLYECKACPLQRIRQLTMATKKRRRMTFEKGGDNVFADIGFANPEREQLKAHLTLQSD